MRFGTQWQIYADDITVRSGRWIDGVYFSDEERRLRIRDAAEREQVARIELEENFRALGFDPSALGAEKEPQKTRSSGKPSSSSSSSTMAPTAGEDAQANISRQSAGCPSPIAHFSVACQCQPSSSKSTAGSGRSSSSPIDHLATDLDRITASW